MTKRLHDRFIGLDIVAGIVVDGNNDVLFFKPRFFSRRGRHHIVYHNFFINKIDRKPAVGIIKLIFEMKVGQNMHLLLGIIKGDIEPAEDIIAQQSTHKGIIGDIVFVLEQIGWHPPEAVRTHFEFLDGGQAHAHLPSNTFGLGNHRRLAPFFQDSTVVEIAF